MNGDFMKRQKILDFLATITLVFSVVSCTNNTDNKVGTENVTPNAQITPVAEKPTTLQTPEKLNTPQASEKPNTPQAYKEPLTPQASEKPVVSPEADPVKSAKLTNEAKFLAGMKVDGETPLASLQKTQTWKSHAAFFDDVWVRLEKQQLSKLRKWTDKELTSINQSSEVIFYPFSGPDFLYGYSFFPKGSTYVLAGLEPVGSLPALEKSSAAKIDRSLEGIDQSLKALLQWSFFRTNDMKVDLSEKGILPILFVFLARTNNQILNVQYIGLEKDATPQVLEKGNKEKLIPGVKIDFVPQGESQPRSLYYFSADLSDSALKKTPEFKKFVQNLGKPVTYLKSASYLLHYGSFSTIRNLVLSQSVSVLQDDSGIPVKDFDRSKWNLRFYGNYTQPISLFQEEYQGDLKSIYQNKTNVKPLSFGIGYRYKVNDSNLMLAIRKK